MTLDEPFLKHLSHAEVPDDPAKTHHVIKTSKYILWIIRVNCGVLRLKVMVHVGYNSLENAGQLC